MQESRCSLAVKILEEAGREGAGMAAGQPLSLVQGLQLIQDGERFIGGRGSGDLDRSPGLVPASRPSELVPGVGAQHRVEAASLPAMLNPAQHGGGRPEGL